jgi:hypothetical protein
MDNSENRRLFSRRRKRSGNLILGIALLVVGSMLFAREFGVDLPDWFFRWELILVVVGISIGIKSGFRDFGWIAVTGLGLFFLSDDIFPGWNAKRFLVPAGLLALGAFIILNRISASARRDHLATANDPDDDKAGIPSMDDNDKSGQPGAIPPTQRFESPADRFNNRNSGDRFTNRGDRFTNKNEQLNNKGEQSPGTPEQNANRGEQFPLTPEQDANRGEQFPNTPEQFVNRGEQFPNTPEQHANRGEQFPNTPEQYANRSGQYNNRRGQNPDSNDTYSNRAEPFNNRGDQYTSRAMMEEEQLDIVSVFSAVNRKVFSKNFVGGEIVCVFGGSEVNMMNADISAGTVELEVVCIFGGATLFIPPNWNVRSEMGSVFGGVDDKRKNSIPDMNRTLIIKGVCIFGGLEVKSKFQ